MGSADREPPSPTSAAGLAGRLARTALANATREFPCVAVNVLDRPGALRLPRQRHPAFYGCYDWHSAVHTHWLLVRLLHRYGDRIDGDAVRSALDAHLTASNLAAEAEVLRAWPGFERPYGWAWLVALAAECEDGSTQGGVGEDHGMHAWADAVRPAALVVADLAADWLQRAGRPVRDGTHANTAFALGLMLDAAPVLGLADLEAAVRRYALARFLPDRDAPLRWEPSGQDFLSPGLCQADLVRRLLPAAAFASWLAGFWPGLAAGEPPDVLSPAVTSDRGDGQLGHLDGLNLSRAAALASIAAALDEADERTAGLRSAAQAHLTAGLPALDEAEYLSSHWLGTFALLAVESVVPLRPPHPDSLARRVRK